MDYETMNDRYYYKDGVLYYKVRVSSNRGAGDVAGRVTKRGYVQLSYKCKRYSAHRVIYCLFHKMNLSDIDGLEIDHINNDTGDNRIENLRLVEHSTNQHNRKDTKDNGDYGLKYKYKNKIPLSPEQREIKRMYDKRANQRRKAK